MKKHRGETKENLDKWLNTKTFDNVEKVKAVTEIYDSLGIKQLAEAKINDYFDKGLKCLDALKVDEERKTELRAFAEMLIDREV